MVTVLDRSRMQALDRIAIEEVGIPAAVLMEVAGRAVADRAEALARARGGRVLAVAGPGNNGADAVVAARHLKDRGLNVDVLLVGQASGMSADLVQQLAVAGRLGLATHALGSEDHIAELYALSGGAGVVIDGLFGTGLARPLGGLFLEVVQAINTAHAPVVAVDIPSGIDADTGAVLGAAVRAHTTVTFQHPKVGHLLYPGREHTGELVVADIGIPRSLLARVEPNTEIVIEEAISAALPARRADTHKGTYGHLLVVAGHPDRPGAALLTARAGLRAGAGLVTVASDDQTIRRLAPALLELMGASMGSPMDAHRVAAALEGKSALAIGPSLEPTAAVAALVWAALEESPVPAVIDAGALAALGTDLAWLKRRPGPTVLTPHPGEMARLSATSTQEIQRDRAGAARALAARAGAHVVLKGASTVIADPDGRVGIVHRGNPGMATAGAGDVLTGVIAGLLAQRVPAPLAARAGALMHALAGDEAARARGEERLVASDLLETLRGPRHPRPEHR